MANSRVSFLDTVPKWRAPPYSQANTDLNSKFFYCPKPLKRTLKTKRGWVGGGGVSTAGLWVALHTGNFVQLRSHYVPDSFGADTKTIADTEFPRVSESCVLIGYPTGKMRIYLDSYLRWLNTVLAVCEYTSFAKSCQEKCRSSQAETWQVKNILIKDAY